MQLRSLSVRAAVAGGMMMMALAAARNVPCVIVPGGVTLLPEQGEDAGKIQSLGARFAHGLITLEEASDLGCRACASPGGGCQFLGTAATSQVVAEALGLAVTHSALAPSGQAIWLDLARRGVIAKSEVREIQQHESLLQSLRIRLHYLAGRREDRLLFDFNERWRRELSRPTID